MKQYRKYLIPVSFATISWSVSPWSDAVVITSWMGLACLIIYFVS